ncbi:MAG: DUF177 domain-containing protein [Bacteroidia bacterium]|nr:DUF177 domain-containing protein [Bacteroidia bacterium]
MPTVSKYLIPLKSGDNQNATYSFVLNDNFFELLEDAEIKKGNVNASLKVKKLGEAFCIDVLMDGSVEVPCVRCLDPVIIEISVDEHLKVSYGEAYSEEDDNRIVIPEDAEGIDMEWLMYEFIVLSIPIQHKHKEGDCNKQMESLLSNYENQLNEQTDPRWDALKSLIKNN